MDAITAKLVDLLSSPIAEELGLIWNFKDDLENMKITMSAIRAVLGDAEGKATNLQVSDWLQNVKDLFLDADDVLDDLAAEALRRRVVNENKTAKEVKIFFSKSNQVTYRLKMGHKLKGIKKRLDHIAKVKNDLKLIESPPEVPILYRERETYSFVPEHEIIGREKEKNCILGYLLDTNAKDNVSVVSIFGIGGLGKTALAQLVYNNPIVQNYFEPKMWVCVSDDISFDVKQVAQKILGQATCNEMEKVQQDPRNKIEGKRFLLVLDDVWNEDRELWLKLKNMLVGGGTGSMIIVTTRSEKVGRIMDTHLSISLEGLDEKESWELFSLVAFKNEEEPNAELVEIGKDIIRKCTGLPLAIRTMGSLLYSRSLGKRDWVYFRDGELSKIDQEENKIFAVLKLSYDHLPSRLKSCFDYCSLFPKDFEIEREMLIQLWVAQGFIQSSDQSRCVEDVGDEYFMVLLSRCFFQDVKLDEDGEIWTCKMHDLMHDLARLVTKNEYLVISEDKEINWGDKIRHLTSELNYGWIKFPTCAVNKDKIRTIFSPDNTTVKIIRRHLSPLQRYESVGGSAASFPKRLRVLDLDLNNSCIREIPKSIGKLKHLRYLDLSNNTSIEKLPHGMTKLHNLQTLKCNNCWTLKELPRDIHKIVSLRHLELVNCDSLICMPQGLGRLIHLQTLSNFVLGNRRMIDSANISELNGINSLRGKLVIESLELQRSDKEEIEFSKLLVEKQYLRELELVWWNNKVEGNELEQVQYKDEMILEALEPHYTIKRLRIMQFCGKRFSKWIGNLTSLMKLQIDRCNYLESLPQSIGNLTSLQELELNGCFSLASLPESIGNLTSLQGLELTECSNLASLPESIDGLTSLKKLKLTKCFVLTSLPESIRNLTSLLELKIHSCCVLTSLPEGTRNLRSLQTLWIFDCTRLKERCEREGGEDWSKIAHIPNVDIA